ncbi:amidase [Rhodococcus sp. IEGM 1401]|uniref:amidase n=1 Tax=unclassified Rhodococcus (in: high G+C Gram-positive bacteria) TaxID=192944 RepID=UPI0022B3FCBE|nr:MULTISPECIES: amidase [unclassified Rhodococcus (in: high G+C Gram-positive bacteria)]MCZ4563385.1 amidase [Rhodococcus sp. IEGM 1401]MDI9923508.1 amidase [Rhodococcus sp. IEGM 1372]MDV8035998.1 amidase [Rhodococcus sp. IEGM 1414]
MDGRRGRDGRAARPERGLIEDGTFGGVVRWIEDRNDTPGPLSGLRIGVKDNIDVAGIETTCASEFFEGNVAASDAEVVTRLRRAGGSVVAKLNMAEFAVGVTSQNSAAGPSYNPWKPSRVPGGSSGGSGIAVAAGLVDASLGTDTGGSVRLPAAACGITGLRPSWGSISNNGVFPVSEPFDTVGPMARSVAEVKALFDVLSPSPSEPSEVTRIGVPTVFLTADVESGVAQTVAAAVRTFAELGYEIVPIQLEHAADAQDIVYTIVYGDLARCHRHRLDTEPSRFQPATHERIALGLSISESDRARAFAGRDLFREAMTATFATVDVVLTPAMPVDVPPRDGGDDVVALSRRMGQFTYPWSLHDGPTLALPVGFHPSSGMPVGAQLTAAAHREGALFGVGERYQSVSYWHRAIPPHTSDL